MSSCREHILAALVVAASLAASAQPSYAQWNPNAVGLCMAVDDQYTPTSVSDGNGGAIVTWLDRRGNGIYTIYAQRVLASGVVDPDWTADGTPLCTRSVLNLRGPTIVADGTGGAIVTWEDLRNGGRPDIYAQRVNADGVVQWATDGVALCTEVHDQIAPTIVTDGAGGAIVTWVDPRIVLSQSIYAQRVNDSGVVQWTANGVPLCTVVGNPLQPRTTIATDMAGGAIITWMDARNPSYDIYAQRVNADGVLQWAAPGVALCTAAGAQSLPEVVSDGAEGAIVTWQDGRNPSYKIYAQRVNSNGVVQWAPDGVALCTAANNQENPGIATDMANGAIVTWEDNRSNGWDIYTQRVNDTGVVWATGGVALCTAGGTQANPTIATDGANGAIVTWQDSRSGGSRIYAQHVKDIGAVDPGWTTNGTPLRPQGGQRVQQYPTIVSDGASGAIVAWMDGVTGLFDIYAQRAYANGGVVAVSPGGQAPFAVHAPHPNPARAAATISLDLPTPQRVAVGVYDVTGRLVRTLAGGGELPAGTHSLVWNGTSDSRAPARAGLYFIRVNAENAVETRRVVILP